MSTITLDEYKALTAKISADSDVVASLGKSVAVSMSFSSVFIRSLFLVILSHRLLKSMNRMESACFTCNINCNITFDFKNKLEEIVTTWDEVIKNKEQINFPKLILRWENDLLEQFENKLENYWIASDKEIKDFAHSISDKLNKHALQ
ncbi:MAG: hypothetical protein C0415_00920 [Thermodesulfovibrio sp.]|nr:hypothetical protein [Thermodesulfovibrio sp.]